MKSSKWLYFIASFFKDMLRWLVLLFPSCFALLGLYFLIMIWKLPYGSGGKLIN